MNNADLTFFTITLMVGGLALVSRLFLAIDVWARDGARDDNYRKLADTNERVDRFAAKWSYRALFIVIPVDLIWILIRLAYHLAK